MRASIPGRPAARGSVASWRRGDCSPRSRGEHVWKRCAGAAPTTQKKPTRILSTYFDTARRAAEFSAYERVFSLWHAVHLPLCVMLFVAAAIHVLAVHLY